MTHTRQQYLIILVSLAGCLLVLLSGCGSGKDAAPLELSSTQPSLLFFYIDN